MKDLTFIQYLFLFPAALSILLALVVLPLQWWRRLGVFRPRPVVIDRRPHPGRVTQEEAAALSRVAYAERLRAARAMDKRPDPVWVAGESEDEFEKRMLSDGERPIYVREDPEDWTAWEVRLDPVSE